MAIRRAGAAKPLSECLRQVENREGREQLKAYLGSRPYPHFEGVPDRPRLLVRIDADGTRTVGRFVNRKFQPVQVPSGARSPRRKAAASG